MTKESRPGVIARMERLVIGLGMSAMAWLLERAVLRSTRRGKAN